MTNERRSLLHHHHVNLNPSGIVTFQEQQAYDCIRLGYYIPVVPKDCCIEKALKGRQYIGRGEAVGVTPVYRKPKGTKSCGDGR